MSWLVVVFIDCVVLIRLWFILCSVVLIRCVINGIVVIVSGMMVVVVLMDELVSKWVNGIIVISRMMNGIECMVLMMRFVMWLNIGVDSMLFEVVRYSSMFSGMLNSVLMLLDMLIMVSVF